MLNNTAFGISKLLLYPCIEDNLKAFKASRRGAAKLVKHVFIDKWKSQESQKRDRVEQSMVKHCITILY